MPKTPISDILMRVSRELQDLAAATDEFHDLAFAQNSAASSMDAAFCRATQRIDLSQQLLTNLSDFIASLAEAAPEHMSVDLEEPLSMITLSDLKGRLCGQSDGTPSRGLRAGQNVGKLELF